VPDDPTPSLERLTSRMDTVEKSAERLKDRDQELAGLRTEIESILYDARTLGESLRPRLSSVQSIIQKLGPAPEKDKAAEAPNIAAERARLESQASVYDAAIKGSELVGIRARQLVTRVQEMRYAIFTRNLLRQLVSPLKPALWHELIDDTPSVVRQLRLLSYSWWEDSRDKVWSLLALLIATPLFNLLLKRFRARLLAKDPTTAVTAPPSFLRRVGALLRNWPLRAMPLTATAVLLFAGLHSIDVLPTPADRIAIAILKGVLLFALVSSFSRCLFSQGDPDWRVLPVADDPARSLTRYIRWGAGVAAVDVALTNISRALFLPVSFTVAQTLVASLAFVGVLIAILLTPFTPAAAQDGTAAEPVSPHQPRWLKMPLWALAIAIVVAALLGYVALARFAAHQIVLTSTLAIFVWLAHLVIRSLTAPSADESLPSGSGTPARLGMSLAWRDQFSGLIALLVNAILAAVAIPLLLLQWGFSRSDILDWVKAGLFGFEIGQFHISLARILLAIVLFTALLFLTRLVQSWLGRNVLTPKRMDAGIANSVHTAIGYVGIGIALLVALSYAGLDITNLAIVAGALSVGIGFGLQSIVNNFVSGLILLVERPIKVGDWIVVKGSEGIVKRISVRSTEIETFDRASIIVPNSDLITGAVTNWTHRNLLGRTLIKISVHPDVEPETVVKLMIDAARAHPLVLSEPAPGATLDALGTAALEFSLRATVTDVTKTAAVASDLRINIRRALREANIPLAAPPATTVASPAS
jgi:small-conductance mechanosensitive channel